MKLDIESCVKFLENNSTVDAILIGDYSIYLQSEWTLEYTYYDDTKDKFTTKYLVEELNREIFILKCKEYFKYNEEVEN